MSRAAAAPPPPPPAPLLANDDENLPRRAPAEAKPNVVEAPTAIAPNAEEAEPLSGAPSRATRTSPSWTPLRAACEGQG
jgi:hypothetical protein